MKYAHSPAKLLFNDRMQKLIETINGRFLFGNRKFAVNPNYLPYQNDQQNIQYVYQKLLYFKEDDLLNAFKKDLGEEYSSFISIYDIRNSISQKKETNCIEKSIFNESFTYSSLNSHIFSASEAYGRIFMPLHSIKRKYRKHIRFLNDDNHLIEIFDMSCCFIQLFACLVMKKYYCNPAVVNQCKKLLNEARNDIYSNILKYSGLSTQLDRTQMKKKVLSWLFSTNFQRVTFHKKDEYFDAITSYFRKKFELLYMILGTYATKFSDNTYSNGKSKRISKLATDCFEFESEMMFGYVIPKLHEKYQNIPFISLHDGILCPSEHIKDVSKDELYNYTYALVDSFLNETLNITNK